MSIVNLSQKRLIIRGVRRIFGILLLFIISLAVISCEDVITVDLKDVEPRLVIEGKYVYQTHSATVLISRTGDYYEPNIFPTVSNAEVTISNDWGDYFTLDEVAPGNYQTDSIWGGRFVAYNLSVKVDNNVYSAQSTVPPTLWLDAVRVNYESGNAFRDDGYVLHCYFIDHQGMDDYGRIVIEQNGELVEGYYLYNGRWSDGQKIHYSYFDKVFEINDTLIVSLYAFDKAVYDYYLTLSNVVATAEGEMFGGVPANPNTNLSNGALGYFGVMTKSSKTIIVQ